MKIKKIIKNKYVIIATVLVVLIVAGFSMFGKKDTGVNQIKVERKDIVQSVLASGKTKAIDSVDLGFEKSGKVANAYVSVGSRVVPGQALIDLDSGELYADLLEAKASLSEEMAGDVTDTVAISDAVANAKAIISKSFTKAENIIREDIDQFFENPGTNSSDFRPHAKDSNGSTFYFTVAHDTRTSINDDRDDAGDLLSVWEKEIMDLSQDDVDDLLEKSETHLASIKEFVDKVSLVIFGLTASNSEFTTILNEYKSDMSDSRIAINTTISELISAREKLNTARSDQNSSESSAEAISAKQAKILQINAQIQNIESQISKTKLTAPFAGVVTKQDVEKGEIVGAGSTIVSIISDDKLEIESNISEVNIGKIVVGNTVSITLDAYPGQTFSGTVSYIDPGETIVDGVVNYKIKINFDVGESNVKSGLTANLNIETAKKTGVVSVPLFAVTRKGDKSYVKKVIGDGMTEETEVVLGITAQDGNVEVLSGLSEGDTVEVGS